MRFPFGKAFPLMTTLILTGLPAKVQAGEKDPSRQDCVLDKSGKICTLTDAEPRSCDSYREFKTAYSYLMDRKSLAFNKVKASRVAMQVATGCNAAAERFIRVFNLLLNAEVASTQALEIAQQMAQADGDSADSFTKIFKLAYLESSLDLSLKDALNLSRRLSIDIVGSSAQASDDFAKIVKYCLKTGGLGLSKPACAKLSQDIVTPTRNYKDKSLADGFIEIFEFLSTKDDGPKLITQEAIALAKELVAIHAEVAKTFKPAYEFASDKEKLGLNRREALTFARNLAGLSQAQAKGKDSKLAIHPAE